MAKQIVVSKDPNKNFDNNDIQFPRLISELQAAGAFTPGVVKALEDSMDLGEAKIFEIVERSDKVWEWIKEHTKSGKRKK